MLSLSYQVRVFVAREPVDFRKAHDGLCAVVRDRFGDDPFSGHLFVFFNRRRDRIKILHWDRVGFWLFYKRLERGTFRSALARGGDAPRLEVDRGELAMILEGIELKRGQLARRFADVDCRPESRDDHERAHTAG